jgi:regulator of protease activity HflC (stomatin/prohibitin superfamily)
MRTLTVVTALSALSTLIGCSGAIVEPGHRALFFDPRNKGLQHEVLGPGYYKVGSYGRLEDFDVTYSTHKEAIHTTSAEGLTLDIHLAVIYRPVVSELYELDTEIGTNYYDEVVGPEFRSASRGVFARHSYQDLAKQNEKIEDEIEGDLRRRIKGKHVEVASITMEAIDYAPEIAAADRSRLVSEREASRQKVALENEAHKQKLALQLKAEQDEATLALQAKQDKAALALQAEHDRIEAERSVRSKQSERIVAEEDAKLAKAQATASIIHARAEAEQRILLARATAEEKRAEAQSITWLGVQMHAYDALGKMGGDGTHILIGDWAKLPNFLFPKMGPGMGGASYPTSPTRYVAPAPSAPDAAPAPKAKSKGPREVVMPTDPYGF